jgi:NAD(P)-dependent dehydrogenase (short-subunit alcohol dehydrogenase family)
MEKSTYIPETRSASDWKCPVRDRVKETGMSSERKVAVITGASQGMGAALVEAYRNRDYGVVATARSIRPTNDDQILAVPGDITDRKTAERAISEGLARFGRIDTLINNAGVFVAKPFTRYTEADYATLVGVNLTGFFHITQLAIAEMEKRHSGHVVQITTSLIEHANSHVPSVLASLTEGRLECRDQIAGDRVCQGRHQSECGCARRHQDADACRRNTCAARQAAPAWSDG